MWNIERIGTEGLVKRLGRTLPGGWRTSVVSEPVLKRAGRTFRPDAVISVEGPDGKVAKVIVELKSCVEPMDVPALVNQLRTFGSGVPLIYAAYLSPRTRERIVELGANFADSTGNLRLAIERPALFIEARGADRDPSPARRPLGSLKGPAAGRVVRALCDFKPPYGVRDLASRTSTPISSVSRVMELLRRDALLDRDERGRVTGVDWEKTIRRWTQDYDLVRSNKTSNWLAPRGLPSVMENLLAGRSRIIVTGSFAAERLAPVVAPRLLALFVEQTSVAAQELDLRPAEAGANVLLLEPFDPVVFDRTLRLEGLAVANPSQAAADLLTSPGRGPAEADALLAWMKEHENVWRA